MKSPKATKLVFTMPIPAILAFCLLAFAGCVKIVEPSPPAAAVLFPAADVCTYPSKAPGNIFRKLGGGTWAAVDPDASAAGYLCAGANETVQLHGGENASINIGYNARGEKEGASVIELEYVAEGKAPIPNESTNRNVFTNLAETVSRAALGTAPPELFRKKLMNLNGYSKPGKAAIENFDVGNGFILLTRESSPENLKIRISVKLFPDVALKLKN